MHTTMHRSSPFLPRSKFRSPAQYRPCISTESLSPIRRLRRHPPRTLRVMSQVRFLCPRGFFRCLRLLTEYTHQGIGLFPGSGQRSPLAIGLQQDTFQCSGFGLRPGSFLGKGTV